MVLEEESKHSDAFNNLEDSNEHLYEQINGIPSRFSDVNTKEKQPTKTSSQVKSNDLGNTKNKANVKDKTALKDA